MKHFFQFTALSLALGLSFSFAIQSHASAQSAAPELEASPDIFENIKNIPLNQEQHIFLDLAGSLRLRGEAWSNYNFEPNTTKTQTQDIFGLSQLRLSANLRAWDFFRFYVEGISALSTPRHLPGGNRSIDVDALDFQNLYIDLKWPLTETLNISLRPGRQEIDLGKQRLMSSLAWVNTRRTFDGVRLTLADPAFSLDALYTQVVQVQPWYINSSSPNNSIYGLYSHWQAHERLETEFYWLGSHHSQSAFQKLVGNEDRQTFGSRLVSQWPSGWRGEVEGAWQVGAVADQTINAGFVATEASYQPPELKDWGKPQFVLGFDYASGDSNPNDKVLNTFNQLYPLAHAYYAYSDVLGRQNAVDLWAGLRYQFLPALNLRLNLHQLWRASQADGIYNTGGKLFRSDSNSNASDLGLAFDSVLSYDLDKHLSFEAGYSYFRPGQFMQDSGSAADLNFAYLSSTYKF